MALFGGDRKTTTTSTENIYNDSSDASSTTQGGGVSASDQVNLRGISGSGISIVKTDSGAIKRAFDFGSEALDFGGATFKGAVNLSGQAIDAVVDVSRRESDAAVKLYDNAISQIVASNKNAQSNVLSAANSALSFATPTEQKVTKYVVIAVAVIGVALAVTFAVRR